MSANNLINYSTSIENAYDKLIKKHENFYKDINLNFTDYFAKVCYDLIHSNNEFINELKNAICDEMDFCTEISHRVGISNEYALYEKFRDIICKYTENEFVNMLNTGRWLKEIYEAHNDKFFDAQTIKFLNTKFRYDFKKFNCFLVVIYYYHALENLDIQKAIIKAFDIMDMCYGKSFLTIFHNLNNKDFLSFSEFYEFFILRSTNYLKNKLFSEIEFEKLPKIYDLRENKLISIENNS